MLLFIFLYSFLALFTKTHLDYSGIEESIDYYQFRYSNIFNNSMAKYLDLAHYDIVDDDEVNDETK